MVDGRDRLTCLYCCGGFLMKNGTRRGSQLYKCRRCGRQCREGGALHGRHFPPELIAAALRLFYTGLTYRGTVAGLEEDPHFDGLGISVQTVHQWVQTYTDAALEEIARYKPETGGDWIFDQMWMPGNPVGFWTVMDRNTRYILASHIFGPKDPGDVTGLVAQALAVSQCQPEDVRSWKLRSSGRTYDAKSNRTANRLIRRALPRATQIRWQVRGSRPTYRMRPQPPLRFGPLDSRTFKGPRKIERSRRFLDGLTLAHNCFTSRKERGGRTPTPCRAAKVDVPFGSWLEVVKMAPNP